MVATSFGAQVEARTVPEKGQSMSERRRGAGEEKAKKDEAVERKCAMMLCSHEDTPEYYWKILKFPRSFLYLQDDSWKLRIIPD